MIPIETQLEAIVRYESGAVLIDFRHVVHCGVNGVDLTLQVLVAELPFRTCFLSVQRVTVHKAFNESQTEGRRELDLLIRHDKRIDHLMSIVELHPINFGVPR